MKNAVTCLPPFIAWKNTRRCCSAQSVFFRSSTPGAGQFFHFHAFSHQKTAPSGTV